MVSTGTNVRFEKNESFSQTFFRVTPTTKFIFQQISLLNNDKEGPDFRVETCSMKRFADKRRTLLLKESFQRQLFTNSERALLVYGDIIETRGNKQHTENETDRQEKILGKIFNSKREI